MKKSLSTKIPEIILWLYPKMIGRMMGFCDKAWIGVVGG